MALPLTDITPKVQIRHFLLHFLLLVSTVNFQYYSINRPSNNTSHVEVADT